MAEPLTVLTPAEPAGHAEIQAPPPLGVDHEPLRREYLADVEARGLTAKTIVNYGADVRVFLTWLGQQAKIPEKATDAELRGFLVYIQKVRKVGVRAVLRYYLAIESFYQFLEYAKKIDRSPVPPFRKRFLAPLRKEAKKNRTALRQLIEVVSARNLVAGILDPRDRAVVVLLLKTGVRREELSLIDVEEIDWSEHSITLKPRPKRTTLIVFFDDEAARVLRDWLSVRALRGAPAGTGPLFIAQDGSRLMGKGIFDIVVKHATACGLHNPAGTLKQKFTPHNCRHWFTTWLRRAGMKREHISWLRGDAPTETIDIYNHIDPKEVRQAYLRFIPQLGV